MINFTDEQKEIMRRAIDELGYYTQTDKAIEEMAELIQALLKYRCCRLNNEEGFSALANIYEELADVSIMLEQLLMIYDPELKFGVADWVKIKLIRLEDRINK